MNVGRPYGTGMGRGPRPDERDVLAMSYKSGPEDMQLVDYAGVLRRRWWLILAVAAIGTVGARRLLQDRAQGLHRHRLGVRDRDQRDRNQVANGRTTGAVNLDTQAQVVQSTAVAQAAAKLMHSTGYHLASSQPGERGRPGQLPGAD